MSTDDRDLAAAFDELTAPPSTANYATRTPALEIRTSSRRWPQALATALAVLVAVAGASTFLALRSARQGGAPSSSTGAPPARIGAAIAYDSTSGMTVMFGGTAGSGRELTDTWTWDGSAWTAAAHGPGALIGARMMDDPAAGGVLLLGIQAPANNGNGVSSGGGCAVGSATGSAGGSGVSSGVPAATPAPGLTPVRPTGPPLGDPLPSAVTVPPTVTCDPTVSSPPAAPAASAQTWVFNSSGWHRAAAGSAEATPPAGAQLAFDPTTRQVVAVSPSAFICGPPLEGAVKSGAAIACPVVGSSSAASAPNAAPCGVPLGCLPTGTISTWTWSNGSWKKMAANQTLRYSDIALVFSDPATQHATLMTQSGIGPSGGIAYPQIDCVGVQSCPAAPAPVITTSTWTGSGWKQVSQLPSPQQAPSLAGATIATLEGHVVVLTTTGQTWTFAAGQWTQDAPSSHPSPRSGAAMAEGPGGSVVLFGGAASSGVFVAAAGQSVGSDTWLWNGHAWQQRGGTAPSPPPSPTTFPCGPTGKTVIPPCVAPLPAEVAPASPVIPQASAPQGHGTPIAQATP